MKGALLLLLWVLSGVALGAQSTGGYCIGNRCFALFETVVDFNGAQDICSQHSGHLMTVRSSVDHDSLSLLLGNNSGQHWIGLHLPKGCPDLTADLRGFQWVTKDTTSNFLNWADTTSAGCSAPRCIFVSNEDKFLWHEDLCKNTKNGFLCEYIFHDMCPGFQNTKVLYTTPYGFTVDDATFLPAGSIAEHPDELKQVCASQQWLKAPWSCEIQGGGCEHKCTMNPVNHPVCYCPSGYIINPVNNRTCEVATDDPCVQLNCEHACYKYLNSFQCICNEGFALSIDMKSCSDFDECLDERQCPADQEKCVNTPGGFDCVCEDGYKLKGGTCVDIDECVSAPCEHLCDNNPGGYDCSCYSGYKVDPRSPQKCKLYCGKEECPAECDPNNHFQCYCPDGYILDEREGGSVCIDIDECEFFSCDQFCENSYGSYECFCKEGFTLVDETTCLKEEIVGPTEVTEVVTVAPTHRPSAVSVGGLVGIIICTVFFVLLAVFLIHHILYSKKKTEGPEARKASECPEAQSF